MNVRDLNPIILREMRGRMRSRRTFVGLTGYVAFLCALAAIVYTAFYYSADYSRTAYNVAAPNIEVGPLIGKTIFAVTVILMLIMLPFTAAALASDAIAGERERQTYEILRITSMSTRRLVLGKLGAVFSFLLLYILLAVPLLSFSFLFGGVSLGEILVAVIALLVTAGAFAAWGLYISSRAKTTKIATALSSSLILLTIYVGPFLLWMGYLVLPVFVGDSVFDNDTLSALLYLYIGGFVVSLNPLGAALLTGAAIASGYGFFIFSIPGQVSLWVISPWLVYVIFYSLLTLLLIQLTTKRLTRISEE